MANWDKITSRGDVDDRRAMTPSVVSGISLTGVALLFLVNYLNGGTMGDFVNELQQLPVQQVQQSEQDPSSPYAGNDSYEVFVSTVLGSTNDVWQNEMNQQGKEYIPPKLVLFRQATESECGVATTQVGPHYCPVDQTIYLDETFFDELTNRFGAKGGDVAQAYVIAHEVGHHVQTAEGTIDGRAQDNDTSIRIELQADCYAGIWANSIKDKGILEKDEISEAMDAAAAVGDDRIQEKVTGYINPESWTHGSSAERLEWFTRGYDSGSVSACDTFQ